MQPVSDLLKPIPLCMQAAKIIFQLVLPLPLRPWFLRRLSQGCNFEVPPPSDGALLNTHGHTVTDFKIGLRLSDTPVSRRNHQFSFSTTHHLPFPFEHMTLGIVV